MSIPYRTRRVLNRLGIVLMIFLLVGVIAWLCWVIWLERYVVYTADGASLDFEHSAQDIIGEVATPPVAQQNISIYYNEGSDALDTGNELTQINGYYISSNMLQNDINGVLGKLERLPAGTPVMIDMKGPYGSFFYPSHLDGAVHSASTDVDAVAALVDTLMNKKFYTIARVCSLREFRQRARHLRPVYAFPGGSVAGSGLFLAGPHQRHHPDMDHFRGAGAEGNGLQRGHAGGFPLPQLRPVYFQR